MIIARHFNNIFFNLLYQGEGNTVRAIRYTCLISSLLLAIFSTALAQEVPPLSARVNDYANILSYTAEQELEARLRDHEERTSNQIAVLTINSLEGGSLEEFSIRTVEQWKLGQKKRENGVLFLVVSGDRQLRIEVGYGLEPYLTDATSGRIIREVVVPYFRANDYEQGIVAGTNAIIAQIEGIEDFSEPVTAREDGPGFSLTSIILAIFAFFSGLFVLRKRRRNAPRKSKKTGLEMRKLSEKEEDVHLDRGQQIEEQIGSVDYDVWASDQPDDVSIVAYKNTFNHRYSKCPNCNYITFYLAKSQIQRSATYSHSGQGVRRYACKNCKHTEARRYSIPRLRRNRTVIIPGGGTFSGGGWGGGGGGFSGGGGFFWRRRFVRWRRSFRQLVANEPHSDQVILIR